MRNTKNDARARIVIGLRTSLIAGLVLAAGSVAFPTLSLAQPAGGAAPRVIDTAIPKGLFLDAPPAGPASNPVVARKGLKVGDEVRVTGRVGGSKTPFVDKRAVVTLVGEELPACSDNPGDLCKSPWDYCCETKADIAKHSATIQVMDDKNRLVRAGLKGQAGISELTELTVVGKVAQVDSKTLVVNATGIYVAPPLPKGLFVKEPTPGAKEPAEVRGTAKPGDIVTVRGRVGGVKEPFGAGAAEFTIVGSGAKDCAQQGGEACATPWDFHREAPDVVKAASARIVVADGAGKPLVLQMKGRHGLAELSEVVVTGTVVEAGEAGLTIAASGIYVGEKAK